MSIERAIFRFAGIMVMISLVLTVWVHSGFVWFTLFIGLNLFQFSFTGFCPVGLVFRKLGLKSEAELAKQ